MTTLSFYFKAVFFVFLLSSCTAMTAQIDSDLNPDDFVINDDLIVDGSACVGFDCVNGLDFDFDTQILKENNLRILFDDTSTGSFPNTDWRLIANDSGSGGAEYFSIEDASAGRRIFTLEARAPTHSLYVDDGGRLGLGTSTPATDVHVISGNTPTVRLDQNGTSGFAPQVWDIAGNETNFFVRDVSNGSTLPLRIRPGAPTSAIFIDVDGDVGLKTASPEGPLHVENTGGDDIDDFIITADGEVGIGTIAPSEMLHVVGDGLITGEFDVLSDIRVKRNIAPIDRASSLVNSLNAVTYEMKQEQYPELHLSSDKQYGLIAQELLEVLPELVTDRRDDDSVDGMMSINYTQLIPILIKANQEQSTEIRELKKSLHLLTERLEKLETSKE